MPHARAALKDQSAVPVRPAPLRQVLALPLRLHHQQTAPLPTRHRAPRTLFADSAITTYDDAGWTQPDAVGWQELEVRTGGQHVSFVCGKTQSMAELEAKAWRATRWRV